MTPNPNTLDWLDFTGTTITLVSNVIADAPKLETITLTVSLEDYPSV